MCFLLIENNWICADDEIDNIEKNEVEKIIQTASDIKSEPIINSRYAIVLDRYSKAVLYGKNEKLKTKMASTTKIMTAIVVLENSNLDSIVEVSSKAAATGGSRLRLKKGDKISVKDLLYGLMLRSGNDAAVALAEYVGKNLEGFAKKMNEKAKEIGLENTNFVTPHGLDSEEHYTTAYELAILTNYALENKIFRDIVNTRSYKIRINGISRIISNTNELLGYLDGVYGVKTGFTNGAGRCLVTAIEREDLNIICIVLGADTKKNRTTDSVRLIEYSFANFYNIDIKTLIEEEFNNWNNINKERINIEKGKENKLELKLEEYNLKYYPIKNNSNNNLEIKIDTTLDITAPVQNNTIIGQLALYNDNNKILEIGILTDKEVKKKNIVDYMIEIVSGYICYLESAIN